MAVEGAMADRPVKAAKAAAVAILGRLFSADIVMTVEEDDLVVNIGLDWKATATPTKAHTMTVFKANILTIQSSLKESC
jgi:hypothetical protein